ncbi:unnamed protein product [Paramecium sonneborni]|uniref:Uncharacterized protein n=1 Tax=Paramecium sonneborni TaxID=65129 RepID=A0A8S1NQJ5_9CILI|nr:unnamed protein product [Paramecium sonneborni]
MNQVDDQSFQIQYKFEKNLKLLMREVKSEIKQYQSFEGLKQYIRFQLLNYVTQKYLRKSYFKCTKLILNNIKKNLIKYNHYLPTHQHYLIAEFSNRQSKQLLYYYQDQNCPIIYDVIISSIFD